MVSRLFAYCMFARAIEYNPPPLPPRSRPCPLTARAQQAMACEFCSSPATAQYPIPSHPIPSHPIPSRHFGTFFSRHPKPNARIPEAYPSLPTSTSTSHFLHCLEGTLFSPLLLFRFATTCALYYDHLQKQPELSPRSHINIYKRRPRKHLQTAPTVRAKYSTLGKKRTEYNTNSPTQNVKARQRLQESPLSALSVYQSSSITHHPSPTIDRSILCSSNTETKQRKRDPKTTRRRDRGRDRRFRSRARQSKCKTTPMLSAKCYSIVASLHLVSGETRELQAHLTSPKQAWCSTKKSAFQPTIEPSLETKPVRPAIMELMPPHPPTHPPTRSPHVTALST